MKTGRPLCSNVSSLMKCAGMNAPLSSFMKPESIGCWISVCTSVISPFVIARTRMVDAIGILLAHYFAHDLVGKPVPTFSDHALPAAAAHGHLDFLGRAIKLAAVVHDRDDVAGLPHFEAIGHVR